MSDPGLSRAERSDSRRWIDVFWRVDVTDWLEAGDEDKTDAELQELARGKLDYHECQVGEECETTGWGFA